MVKHLTLSLTLLLATTLQAQQIADLAPEWRQRNRGGSCGHCSTKMHLNWLGLLSQGSDWWATYRGGEMFGRHLDRLRSKGIKFVATNNGDARLLEYASWSRRGAVVYHPPRHITNFIGIITRNGQKLCVILDNNHPNRFDFYPYDDWLRRWRRNGGDAFVILDSHAPPPVPGGPI